MYNKARLRIKKHKQDITNVRVLLLLTTNPVKN